MSDTQKMISECEKSIIYYTKHLKGLRKQIGFVEEAKRYLKDFDANTDLTEIVEIENLTNFNGYLTISNLDLAVNFKNLLLSNTEWEKIFFAKNTYLIIHETLLKLSPQKKNNFLEKSIKKDFPKLLKDVNHLTDEIDKFKKTPEYKILEKVRHYTAGHIVESLKRYYDILKDLKEDETLENIRKFMRITDKALNLSKEYSILSNKRTLENGKVVEEKFRESLIRLNKFLEK